MNREYSVLYFSAPQLFNTLAKNVFDKNDIDAHNMCEYIFDCDLLIIDDLGTEYTNAFIASQFFTCIDVYKRQAYYRSPFSFALSRNMNTLFQGFCAYLGL